MELGTVSVGTYDIKQPIDLDAIIRLIYVTQILIHLDHATILKWFTVEMFDYIDHRLIGLLAPYLVYTCMIGRRSRGSDKMEGCRYAGVRIQRARVTICLSLSRLVATSNCCNFDEFREQGMSHQRRRSPNATHKDPSPCKAHDRETTSPPTLSHWIVLCL